MFPAQCQMWIVYLNGQETEMSPCFMIVPRQLDSQYCVKNQIKPASFIHITELSRDTLHAELICASLRRFFPPSESTDTQVAFSRPQFQSSGGRSAS